MPTLQQIDFWILDWIQHHFQGKTLDFLMPLVTALGNGGWLFILVAAAFMLSRRYRRQGFALAIALLCCFVVGNLILKPLFARMRPFEVANVTELLIRAPRDFSFPSGHTMAAFSFAGVFWHYLSQFGRWAIAAVILALLIAFSRLYLYVHFPTDVLCGALLGVLFAKFSSSLCDRRWQNRS